MSLPLCDFQGSLSLLFFCDLWLLKSLLWCKATRKYGPTAARFSQCLPPCISMHFITQANGYPLRTHMFTQVYYKHYLTFFVLCHLFFRSNMCGQMYKPLPTRLLAGVSLYAPLHVHRRAKWVSGPRTTVLLKILHVAQFSLALKGVIGLTVHRKIKTTSVSRFVSLIDA